MFLLLGAMDQEIEGYLSCLHNSTCNEWMGWVFHRGTISGVEIVVAKCGVGKVLSAMITQKLIDTFEVEHVLFTGIAGGINTRYEIGDIIIAKDTLQHDIDVRSLGFKRGSIPYTNLREVACDPVEGERLFLAAHGHGTVHQGRILTGDVFLSARDTPEYEYLTKELDGDAVEMEGASVGTVSFLNGIPFNLLRIISDKADGKAPAHFTSFLRNASHTLKAVIENYFEMKAHSKGS
ncbi:MAG: 5'-methylthioadenosine/adenosylhomocysteine nucleosidase [Spirochaetales bacterium]|nr:5'-methylthioadenosine/adenosylhomocysteine nucleosidase [Spirochaetales bacterium]